MFFSLDFTPLRPQFSNSVILCEKLNEPICWKTPSLFMKLIIIVYAVFILFDVDGSIYHFLLFKKKRRKDTHGNNEIIFSRQQL